MTERVKVLISNRQKDVKIPSGIRLLIRRCCHAVLIAENFQDRKSTRLNSSHR